MRSLFVALLLLVPALVAAQDAPSETVGTRYRVVLTDGSTLTGTIAAASADEITLETAAGLRTTIPRARIRSLRPLTGAFDRADPTPTRLLFFPTARSLPAGAGRFGTYFIFPTVAYGLSNTFDVSLGGTIPIEGYGVVNLNAKLTPVQAGAFSFAVGASALLPYGDGADGLGGTFYGVATFGPPEQAFTLGALGGYAGADTDDLSVGNGGAVVVGFEKQVSNSVKLLTENYVGFSESETALLLSAGVRFFGERLSADIAPVLVVGGGEAHVIPIPYFTFSYAFGR